MAVLIGCTPSASGTQDGDFFTNSSANQETNAPDASTSDGSPGISESVTTFGGSSDVSASENTAEPGQSLVYDETDTVKERLSVMTTEEKIGQLLICRIPGGTVYSINDETRTLAEKYYVGGFILFGENIETKEQVITLTTALRSLSEFPMLIATDEEGGRVSRIGKLYDEKISPAYKLGETGDPDLAYEAALTIGKRLIELGINMDFAPVADIFSNNKNTIIGDRAYGSDPKTAAVMVEAAVRGYKDAGVLSVLKHFPGHGDTAEDSHVQLALYNHDRERFDQMEAVPFKQGIAAGADGVMVGHIATPLLQNANPVVDWMELWHASGQLPATFSDFWMETILRDEWAFDGLIVTDGLEMKALTNTFDSGQIAVGSFMAGADILLIPSNPTTAFNALLTAYQEGIITDERLDASVERILRVKLNL